MFSHILINKRFRNAIKRVTPFPGAVIGSDHGAFVADIKLRLKRDQRPKSKINTTIFEKIEMRNKTEQELNCKIKDIIEELVNPEELRKELKI